MAVTINGTNGIETNTDTGKVKVGADDDLLLQHDGNNSTIDNSTGDLLIRQLGSSGDIYLDPKSGERGVKVIRDGAVELYYNGVKKFETNQYGNKSLQHLYMDDSHKLQLGSDQDLQIYHTGSNAFQINGTGNTLYQSNEHAFYNADASTLLGAFRSTGFEVTGTQIMGNAGSTNPWDATGNVADGVALNTTNFPITANNNDQLVAIMNRTNGNGVIIEFKYNGSVVGSISSNGASLPSDRDFKTNISDLNLGLSLVNKLKPSQFNYKIDAANTPVMYGLIAQELEEAITSEGVTKNSTQLIQHHPTDDTESNYDVDYLKLVPILINSIKELSTEVNTLKTKVAALEAA